MAIEQARKLLEKVKTDQALAKKLENASNEEREKIITGMGYDFTEEEFKTAMAESGQLSDSDLDAVAGGDSATWVAAGATVVGAAAGAAAAAA